MARLPINYAPTVMRDETSLQRANAWVGSHLVRFHQGARSPFGGWRTHSTTTMTGSPRRIINWRDNSNLTWAAIGTHSNLYAMARDGTLYDITPVGFTSGRADATTGAGYGAGTYGSGTYGTPRPDTSTILDASVWSIDTFGQYINGCMTDDGKLYEWQLNTGVKAAAISGAPTADACFVTNEGMLCALGAGGFPRRAQWSDQRVNTTWIADATNQAGDYDLQTNGRLMLGLRIRGGHLLLTDQDCWSMTYLQNSDVYGFDKVGDKCGAISRNCAVALDARAVWMGKNGFYMWNGYVQRLDCSVQDYVFSDMNTLQVSKVTAVPNGDWSEVKFYYPSANSTENDRYVVYKENPDGSVSWYVGMVARLCGCDRGAFQYPMECATDGYVYDHECGWSYTGATAPYLDSGPIMIGNGDNTINILRLYPDDRTLGDVNVTFFTRLEPDDAEVAYGPYTVSRETDLRVPESRFIRMRLAGVNTVDWRVGDYALEIELGGER